MRPSRPGTRSAPSLSRSSCPSTQAVRLSETRAANARGPSSLLSPAHRARLRRVRCQLGHGQEDPAPLGRNERERTVLLILGENRRSMLRYGDARKLASLP